MSAHPLYGVVAEFDGLDPLVGAARAVRETGTRRLETFTPFASEVLEELVAGEQRLLPVLTFVFGLIGLIGFYFLEYWCAVLDYPINVGGRPLFSWPAFVPSAFEVGLIWAAAAAFVAFFALNRMPRLHHPLSAVPGFEHATQDAFFLCVEAGDPKFDHDGIHALLARHGAIRVLDVPS